MPTSTLSHRVAKPVHRSRVIPTLAVALLLGCDEELTRQTDEMKDVTATPAPPTGSTETPPAELSTMDLLLPFSATVSTPWWAFYIKQTGPGHGSRFEIANTSSVAHALSGITSGFGTGVLAENVGKGRGALIATYNQANFRPALELRSASIGGGQNVDLATQAAAMDVRAINPDAVVPAALIESRGKGTVLNVNHKGTAGAIATFQSGGVNRARISKGGKGFFNGGTQTGGADLAEAFEVVGSVRAYEPGDVLAISESSERKVEKSDEPYSTRVIGVYATKPGVLLTERDIDASMDDMIPLGVIGVIPTKVSAENGAIQPGDLLVTAGTPGHAMAADPTRLHFGMVLGKALEQFAGPGTGTIRVLVNVK